MFLLRYSEHTERQIMRSVYYLANYFLIEAV